MIQLRFEFSSTLAFCKPDDTSEHADDGEDSPADGERLDHFTALREA